MTKWSESCKIYRDYLYSLFLLPYSKCLNPSYSVFFPGTATVMTRVTMFVHPDDIVLMTTPLDGYLATDVHDLPPADHWYTAVREQIKMLRSHLLMMTTLHPSLQIHLYLHLQSYYCYLADLLKEQLVCATTLMTPHHHQRCVSCHALQSMLKCINVHLLNSPRCVIPYFGMSYNK